MRRYLVVSFTLVLACATSPSSPSAPSANLVVTYPVGAPDTLTDGLLSWSGPTRVIVGESTPTPDTTYFVLITFSSTAPTRPYDPQRWQLTAANFILASKAPIQLPLRCDTEVAVAGEITITGDATASSYRLAADSGRVRVRSLNAQYIQVDVGVRYRAPTIGPEPELWLTGRMIVPRISTGP